MATQSEGRQNDGIGGSARDAQDNSDRYGGSGIDRDNYGDGGRGGSGSGGSYKNVDTFSQAKLDFKTDFMKNYSVGSDYGDIGSYESFQKMTGDFGFETLQIDELSKMTQTKAQDYIDSVSGKVTQRFEALEKVSVLDNISRLQTMQTNYNLRTVEKYDPETASVTERYKYNSAVRDLQATGVTTDLAEDTRVGDLGKLALSTASLMTGNPLGLVSAYYQVSKLASKEMLSPMGQLASYGKFTDKALSNINLDNSQLTELGTMQGQIEDFAQTVETAAQNRELDSKLQELNRKSNNADDRFRAITQNIEAIEKEQVQAVETPTTEVGGGVQTTKKGNLGFSRDVSNKGLGDVVSVFGQITAPNEDEITESNTGYRFSLANLFGRF